MTDTYAALLDAQVHIELMRILGGALLIAVALVVTSGIGEG